MAGGYRIYDLNDLIRTINGEVSTALSPDVTDTTQELVNQVVGPEETTVMADAASVTASAPATTWGAAAYGDFAWQ